MAEAMKFEELRVLQAAEVVADGIWREVVQWDSFAREVVGGQLARAADSIGANDSPDTIPLPLFSQDELIWLAMLPNT